MAELERDIEKWWPKLPESTRTWFIEHEGEPLSADALTSLVHTRGYGPVSAYFVDSVTREGEKGNFYLTPDETDWIRENGTA